MAGEIVDPIVRGFPTESDNDLMICRKHGVAYQADMTYRAAPGVNANGENYFDHYAPMEGNEVARNIHLGRVEMVNWRVGKSANVLDTGIGCGEFIKARPNTFGQDVNPKGVQWLRDNGKLREDMEAFRAFTFWDVLEHVENPDHYFRRMPDCSHLFATIPVFDDLSEIRKSKHYKPGEHLYYWTKAGFIQWMERYRFHLLERSDFEVKAGRESVRSFAFQKMPASEDGKWSNGKWSHGL